MVLATLIVVRGAAQQSATRADSLKAATIRRLLELTDAAGTITSAVQTMVPTQRSAHPEIPSVYWDVFLDHVKRGLPQLIDSLIPVYATRFTQAELDQMVQFYSSPAGRHLAQAQPDMLQQDYEIGRHWGARIGAELQDSLSNAGGVWSDLSAQSKMRSDLRRLIVAEEDFFADSVRYTTTIGTGGLDYQLSPDNKIEVLRLTPDGWVATISSTKTKTTCSIFIGATSIPPAVKEGEPMCQEAGAR